MQLYRPAPCPLCFNDKCRRWRVFSKITSQWFFENSPFNFASLEKLKSHFYCPSQGTKIPFFLVPSQVLKKICVGCGGGKPAFEAKQRGQGAGRYSCPRAMMSIGIHCFVHCVRKPVLSTISVGNGGEA